MRAGHIVALGGGGFSMEESPVLDDYILTLANKERPNICFVPTASGDSDNYIVRFYRRFNASPCTPTHLDLFRRTITDLNAFAATQDIFYVGGGNSINMLAIWERHGFDRVLRSAYDQGKVLSGVSAGSLCWFEAGVTDSFGSELQPMNGLGIIGGSHCPHYDGEAKRRPAYQRLVRAGMPGGFAADDGAALHFSNAELLRVVTSRPNAKAYRVELLAGEVQETEIAPQRL
jgi:peptidase E